VPPSEQRTAAAGPDAPPVPGHGPRWVGDAAERRARSRGWMRWWWSSAWFGALGVVCLVGAFLVEDQTDALLAWFGAWTAAILCMVPAWRTGWAQRHDRYDDELCRYASGVRAQMSLRSGDGVVHLADRVVGTSSVDSRDRRRVEVDAGVLSLEERVLDRADDGAISRVEVRLVDDAGVVLASAEGDRRGGRVDWSLHLPLGVLRLRQRLEAVPSRRTVLDAGGRAWRVRAEADAPSWSADLPEHAGVADAVFVTWFACHLDAVGLERCYGVGSGPAVHAADGGRTVGTSWKAVGTPGVRPGVPTASGGGFDL
jgi:hypothetical protein